MYKNVFCWLVCGIWCPIELLLFGYLSCSPNDRVGPCCGSLLKASALTIPSEVECSPSLVSSRNEVRIFPTIFLTKWRMKDSHDNFCSLSFYQCYMLLVLQFLVQQADVRKELAYKLLLIYKSNNLTLTLHYLGTFCAIWYYHSICRDVTNFLY